MMKFDFSSWVEFDGQIEITSGLVQVLCTGPASFFIGVEDSETLAGSGSSFRARVSFPVMLRVACLKGVRSFYFNPVRLISRPFGEVFTNLDQRPVESGTVAEIRKTLRLFEIKQAHLRREISIERMALQQSRKRHAASVAVPPAVPPSSPSAVPPEAPAAVPVTV
uniref:Uncharacterized protein n=1 Tax=uncultured prokaryote TaxID=198431 RepID=A0A0H5Q720_9ZZZZ|nr:hypothetical protein [uncultured prokaryote]